MPLSFVINSVDKTDTVRWTEWDMTECAKRGQVGTGVLVIDDPSSDYVPPGQKSVAVSSSYGVTTERLFTGYIAERSVVKNRGGAAGREWRVTLEDLNVRLDDRIITDAAGGKRPEESDYARITWLLTTTAMTGISAGEVINANNVTMDKADYRGKRPRDVLEECAQAAGKNFFLYQENSADGIRLFYTKANGTRLTQAVTVTDDATAVNGTTYFACKNVSYELDPSGIYSRVRVKYGKGAFTTEENATTAANYRTREVYKTYMRAKTAAGAQRIADQWLDAASQERGKLRLTLDVTTEYVNLFRAGYRIKVELARYDIDDYYRIVQRRISQVSDDLFRLELEFRSDLVPTLFQQQTTAALDNEDFSNATDEDSGAATVSIDTDGITVTNGSITVANSNGTIIIDGTSDFFSIVAQGTITIPRTGSRGTTYQSVAITTGLSGDPAANFYTKIAARDGKGNWGSLLPVLELSASGTVLRMLSGRTRYMDGSGDSARTQVQVARFTSSPPDGEVTIRYYILQKATI